MANLIKYNKKAGGSITNDAQVEVELDETVLDNSDLEPEEPHEIDIETMNVPETSISRRSDLQDFKLPRERERGKRTSKTTQRYGHANMI